MDIEASKPSNENESSPAGSTLSASTSSGCRPADRQPHRPPSPPPQGTWLHAAYHLTTGTAGASTPNLPAAMASLGWGPGIFFLVFFAITSFYAYYLLILVLDYLDRKGKRSHDYGEVSTHFIGRRWNTCLIAPLSFVVCFTTVISFVLLGGQSLKAIFFMYAQPHSKMKLPHFIAIFGLVSTVLAQLPTFHSLRHLNLFSFLASLAYALLVVIGSITAYYWKDIPSPHYTLPGSTQEKMMNAFNSFSILSAIYGNALLVETQATITSPIKHKMTKGLCLCYGATIATFFPVAIAGYWAFGNSSNSNIILSMISPSGENYIPSWMVFVINFCMIMQLIAGSVLYSQPTFEIIDRTISQLEEGKKIWRKIMLRTLLRIAVMALATLLAAMFPFFGDFNAIVGSMGYTPIVFIFPMLFYVIAFDVQKHSLNYNAKVCWMILFIIVALIGSFTSIRQLIQDERTFKLFANI